MKLILGELLIKKSRLSLAGATCEISLKRGNYIYIVTLNF